jgi:hypothetical protein
MQKLFEVGQIWRTRDGRIAVIEAIEAHGKYPVKGSILGVAESWTLDGVDFIGHELSGDLVGLATEDDLNAQMLDDVRESIERAVARAAERGVVVTVAQVPLQPLAMGHYETIVSVRMAREHA